MGELEEKKQALEDYLLHKKLPVNLACVNLPLAGELCLYLLDETNMHRPLSSDETAAAWDEAPYWLFCWASGLAMARMLERCPELVAGKTVLDVGSGSGVVAIAAALAGAARVIACDIDAMSCAAIELNALLNKVDLDINQNAEALHDKVDVIVAADILYDPENFSMLDRFRKQANDVFVADSRVKKFPEKMFSDFGYQATEILHEVTIPDLGELEIHKEVRIFHAHGG
jgi:predicted nicotinamide N-methyase